MYAKFWDFLTPPPCANWLLMTQPPLLRTLFHFPPMRTYFMDAPNNEKQGPPQASLRMD